LSPECYFFIRNLAIWNWHHNQGTVNKHRVGQMQGNANIFWIGKFHETNTGAVGSFGCWIKHDFVYFADVTE